MPIAQDPDLIRLSFNDKIVPDWRSANRQIACLPGCAVVEMLCAPNATTGGILLPDIAKHTHYEGDTPVAGFEPNLGVVLSIGYDHVRSNGECVISEDIMAGDIVIVRDGDGIEIENFSAGSYVAKGMVRMFGVVVPNAAKPWEVEGLPLDESLLAVVGELQ